MSEQTATFAEFARIAGFRRSYITQMRKDDRLVLDPKGRILVDATLSRLAETADPSKAGVSERWSDHRQQRDSETPVETTEPDDSETPPPESRAAAAVDAGMSYQAARAIKERYLAMAAKRDYEFSMGKLLNAADAADACSNAATIMRTRLETLPDVIGPQLAPITDEQACRAMIAESIHQILDDMARDMAAVAGPAGEANHG